MVSSSEQRAPSQQTLGQADGLTIFSEGGAQEYPEAAVEITDEQGTGPQRDEFSPDSTKMDGWLPPE